MNTSALFLGIIPLLVFVIVDSFGNLKMALISAIVLAVIEAIGTIIYFGEIDFVSISSLVLVIAFAMFSYKTKKEIYFKLQPVVLSVLIGGMLLTSYLMERSLILEMTLKYQEILPAQIQDALKYDKFRDFLNHSTLSLSIGMFIHASITAIAAYKLSNWWWIALRGIGFYLIAFICQLYSRMVIFGS